MNDREKEILSHKLVEYYSRLGQEVPEEANFFLRTVIKMDLDLFSSWTTLENILPKAKFLLNAIDEKIEEIYEQDPHERNFQTTDIKILEHNYWATDMTYSSAGSIFAYCTSNNETHLISTKDPNISYTYNGELGGIREITCDPFYLAYVTKYDQILLWEIEEGKINQKFKGNHLAMCDGQIAFCDQGGKLSVYIPLLNKERWSTRIDNDPISHISISRNGYIATSHNSGKVIVWKSEQPITKWIFNNHQKDVPSIEFSPDGRILATGSLDCTINIYETVSGKMNTIYGHQTGIRCLAFSPDGEILASGSDDGIIFLWDTTTGKMLQKLQGHSQSISCVTFTPDGKKINSGSLDGTIRSWQE